MPGTGFNTGPSAVRVPQTRKPLFSTEMIYLWLLCIHFCADIHTVLTSYLWAGIKTQWKLILFFLQFYMVNLIFSVTNNIRAYVIVADYTNWVSAIDANKSVSKQHECCCKKEIHTPGTRNLTVQTPDLEWVHWVSSYSISLYASVTAVNSKLYHFVCWRLLHFDKTSESI